MFRGLAPERIGGDHNGTLLELCGDVWTLFHILFSTTACFHKKSLVGSLSEVAPYSSNLSPFLLFLTPPPLQLQPQKRHGYARLPQDLGARVSSRVLITLHPVVVGAGWEEGSWNIVSGHGGETG